MSGLSGLPGNLGNIDINGLVALFKSARDAGQSALEAAVAALVGNPQIQSVVDRLRGLLGKPVVELTDQELTDLIGSWHKGLTAKSKDMVIDPPDPPDPPVPAEFPYMTKLTSAPDLSKLVARRDKVYKSDQGFFTVSNGAGPQPNEFWPDFGTGWTTDSVAQP